MERVKRQNIEHIEDNTVYEACTIYHNEHGAESFSNCVFENCSFRDKFSFKEIGDSQFINCSFSSDVIYIVSHTDIDTLPTFPIELPITQIVMWDCELKFLGDLKYLDKLKLIEMPANLIEEFDFTKIPHSVERLFLDDNYINKLTITKEWAEKSKIRELDLSSNMIPQLPDEMCKLRNINYLDIRHNNIYNLQKDLWDIKILHMEGNAISKDVYEKIKIRRGNTLSEVYSDGL